MELLDAAELALVRELTQDMHRHGVSEVELEVDGRVFRLRAGPTAGSQVSPRVEQPSPVGVPAPGVGRFLRVHPARLEPESEEGSPVDAGAIIGYVATGDLLRPVTAPCKGQVRGFLARTGDLVSFGTPVAEITTSR